MFGIPENICKRISITREDYRKIGRSTSRLSEVVSLDNGGDRIACSGAHVLVASNPNHHGISRKRIYIIETTKG